MLFTIDPPQNKRYTGTDCEGIEKIFHANGNRKKARVMILISDKMDFKTKAITRDNKGHYIILKGSIQQEDVTLVNICTKHGSTKIIYKENLGGH